MREAAGFGPFRGVYWQNSISIPETFGPAQLNARMAWDGIIRPRLGFRTPVPRPAGVTTYKALGLNYLTGYDQETFAGHQELVAIEGHDGTYRPWQINLSTGARTEIKHNGVSVNLPNGEYKGVCFNGDSYWINPGVQTPLYKHVIGDLNSWVGLVDTAYVAAPDDPNFTVKLEAPRVAYAWAAADTCTFTGAHSYINPVTKVYGSDGSLTLKADSLDDNGAAGGYFQSDIQFAAVTDLSGADCLAIALEAGPYMRFFLPISTKPEIEVGGVFTAVTDAKFVIDSVDSKKAVWLLYVKGMTINAAQAIRFRFQCKPGRGATSLDQKEFVTIRPLLAGGTYLEAETAAKRPWDSALDGDGVLYGVRFKGPGPVYSNIIEHSITATQGHGNRVVSYAPAVGAIVNLLASAPAGVYNEVEFLRQDASTSPDPTWRILGSRTAEPYSFTDARIEPEVQALPSAGTGTLPAAQPSFSTRGVVDAVPWKGRVVWLRSGGTRNVSHSRIGVAEETFEEGVTYPTEDIGHPGDFDLSDDLTDEPVTGFGVGNGLIIFGKAGVYSQIGNYMADIVPPRLIPGSEPVVSRFACCVCTIGGNTGCAWLGHSGKVWFTTVEAVFASDATAKPLDLTLDLGYSAFKFLFADQVAEFGYVDLGKARLAWDVVQQSLWVVLGRRALVHRVGSPDFWEPYEYQLTNPPGSSTISVCSDWNGSSLSASSIARAGSTVVWSTPLAAASDDGVDASAVMSFGSKSELLRVTGLRPAISLPVDASLTSIPIEIQDQGAGDIPCVLDLAYVLRNGVRVGANLATGQTFPDSETTLAFTVDPMALGISAADVNNGLLGFELGATADTADAGALVGANWSIVKTNATGPIFTINVTYTGPGIKPSFVYLTVSSRVAITLDNGFMPAPAVPWSGEGTADNGLGVVNSGSIWVGPPGDLIVVADSASRIRVPLVAGVGSLTVTRSGTGTASTMGTEIVVTYSGDAVFSPYVPRTIGVDVIRSRECYDLVTPVPGQSSGIGWDFVDFAPGRKQLALRSSGHVDELEWDSSLNRWIEGSSRDGGRSMPDGYRAVQLGTFERTKIAHVEANQLDPVAALTIEVGGITDSLAAGKRWARFGALAAGYQQQIFARFDESLTGILSLVVHYDTLGQRFTK